MSLQIIRLDSTGPILWRECRPSGGKRYFEVEVAGLDGRVWRYTPLTGSKSLGWYLELCDRYAEHQYCQLMENTEGGNYDGRN
jgi:hypothetical protein